MNSTPAIPESPAVPWTPLDVLWAVVAALAWVFLLFALEFLLQETGLSLDPSLIISLGSLGLLGPVWYFAIYKYQAGWQSLGLRPFTGRAVGLGCGLMLLSLLFNMVYGALLASFDLQIQPNIDQVFEHTRLPWLLLFGGIVVAPLVEEIFFRGFVFAGLRTRWPWPRAALVSALLFALAHIIPTSILPILLLGLIFAALYQLSGSIWPAILMHMLTNSVALLTVYAISQGLLDGF